MKEWASASIDVVVLLEVMLPCVVAVALPPHRIMHPDSAEASCAAAGADEEDPLALLLLVTVLLGPRAANNALTAAADGRCSSSVSTSTLVRLSVPTLSLLPLLRLLSLSAASLSTTIITKGR